MHRRVINSGAGAGGSRGGCANRAPCLIPTFERERFRLCNYKRIVGVDINAGYLDKVRQRFGTLAGLELHCLDLAAQDFSLAPLALVHAALIFEHVGIGFALEHALSLVAPGGSLSVVLQLPGVDQQNVTSTCYTSMQTLKRHFEFIDISEFRALLEQKGFRLVEQESRSLPAGKGLWFGVFAQSGDAGATARVV